MRLVDSRYRCSWCGQAIDIPVEPAPDMAIRGAKGSPTVMTLRIQGRIIHRCELNTHTPFN